MSFYNTTFLNFLGQVGTFAAISSAILVSAFALNVLYNLFLHPLALYPGPKVWAATRFPWTLGSIRGLSAIKGDLIFSLQRFHEQYGPVVRIAPNELSFNAAAAWKDIYGHRDIEMPKDQNGAGLPRPIDGVDGILSADRENHARMRKLIGHAFSERALREQEPFLKLYVEKLMDCLRSVSQDGAQDMAKWFNWTTFDVIGDLAFGEPFGSLEVSEYHPFVALIFNTIKAFPYLQAAQCYRVMPLLRAITPKNLLKAYKDTMALGRDKVERRLSKPQDARKDFMSHILRHNDDKGMTRQEIQINATQLIIAGSETSATVLCGATYHLLRDERVYGKLVAEIRQAFEGEADITMQSVAELKYLHAVIDEALRQYPASAATLPRVVPGKGAVIAGNWVPGGTTVGVHHWSTFQSPRNFHEPQSFIPERWLEYSDPSSPFADDDRAAFQPFSVGPRNCVGKNLAYAEIKLILSHLLWSFDLTLADESLDWRRHKAYLVWDKPPLMVHLKRVART